MTYYEWLTYEYKPLPKINPAPEKCKGCRYWIFNGVAGGCAFTVCRKENEDELVL